MNQAISDELDELKATCAIGILPKRWTGDVADDATQPRAILRVRFCRPVTPPSDGGFAGSYFSGLIDDVAICTRGPSLQPRLRCTIGRRDRHRQLMTSSLSRIGQPL